MSVVTEEIIHLTPDDYHVIRPEDFGAPGLSARESIGPFTGIRALGSLVTVHDSRFAPGRGIGHHPHQGMERLFYILEGTVDHDDALNGITGHMRTGDLGILTEGRRGMIHSEWNNSDRETRAYIFVYPTEPTPPTAAFDAIRDETVRRDSPADGVTTKRVVTRGETRLHGDMREIADTELAAGASVDIVVAEDEAGLLFVVTGAVTVHATETVHAGTEHTVLVAPAPPSRTLRVTADEPSRVIHAITGPGFGLRTAD